MNAVTHTHRMCLDCIGAGETIHNDTNPYGYGPDPQCDVPVTCMSCDGAGWMQMVPADPMLELREARRDRYKVFPINAMRYGALRQRVVSPVALPGVAACQSFGFGVEFTIPGMVARKWTAGRDGIRRWCDNGQPVDTDTDFIAAMSADLPPIHAPRPLDEMEASEGICAHPIEHDNSDIAVSESAIYSLTPAMLAEGDACEERR